MAKIRYIEKNFRKSSLNLIAKCNVILQRFTRAGYDMTLRQLYYQLVAADEIPNTPQSYDNVGSLINDARLAGLVDWEFLVDRTRSLQSVGHWESPAEIMNAVAGQYRRDKWETQPVRPEVWIEKEALAGVFERVCRSLDVAFFSCRGYTSQSEMHSAAERLRGYNVAGQETIIFHFGDHDPSGMDMTRDIRERLHMFGAPVEVRRLALNMKQIRQFRPPPNPAKLTDCRAKKYCEEFGLESWELDALSPETLSGLVRREVLAFRDEDLWSEAVALEAEQRAALRAVSGHFDSVQKFVKRSGWLKLEEEKEEEAAEEFEDEDDRDDFEDEDDRDDFEDDEDGGDEE
jgi:hypothetical protein